MRLLALVALSCLAGGVSAAVDAVCPNGFGKDNRNGALNIATDANATMPFWFWRGDGATTFAAKACDLAPGSYEVKAFTLEGEALPVQWVQVQAGAVTEVRLPAPDRGVNGTKDTARVKRMVINGTRFFAVNPCTDLHGANLCDFNAQCASSFAWRSRCTCNSGYGGDGFNCSACQPGSRKLTRSNTPCVKCRAGYFSNQTNQSACTMCKADRYQDLAGQTVCKPCARGATSAAGSERCDCIENGTKWQGDGKLCVQVNNCRMRDWSVHGCHNESACAFTAPGENTCACNLGYYGDGSSCSHVDNCAGGAAAEARSLTGKWGGCSANGTCTKTGPGGNTCACNFGYSGAGKSCAYINACLNPGMNDCDEEVCSTRVFDFLLVNRLRQFDSFDLPSLAPVTLFICLLRSPSPVSRLF